MPDPQTLPMRVRRRADPLARRILGRILDEVPVYRTLSRAQLDGEVLRLCAVQLRLLTVCLDEGRGPTEEELERAREGAVLRARQHLPLAALISAYTTGAIVSWEALVDEATDDEQALLPGYATQLIGALSALTTAIVDAWAAQVGQVATDERSSQRAVTEALLAGEDPPVGTVERAGVQLGPRMRVLAVRLGVAADVDGEVLTEAVATRRQHQRVIEELEALQHGPVLSMLDGSGGALLTTLEDLGELHERLTAAARADLWIAASDLTSTHEIAGQWRQVREVRHIVIGLRRPPGLYVLDDVLLEYTVMRDAAAASRLCRTLDPIDDRPELLETLQAWFDASFDRRETASTLNIHPNTLDYRLRRASEALGHDLSSAAGTQLLGAALIARRLTL